MATVERFEDLEVWQKARDVVNAVYQASLVGTFSRDYALRDQIRRAVVSIPANTCPVK
jgi:four helix bundle protein